MMLKVSPDREKARSILKLSEERQEFLKTIDTARFPTNAGETYYEIIIGLATAILLTEGLKAEGGSAHKETLFELSRYGFYQSEIALMDDLRSRRNRSYYEGRQIQQAYLENHRQNLLIAIAKLKAVLQRRLE